jgi:hypothetical protein
MPITRLRGSRLVLAGGVVVALLAGAAVAIDRHQRNALSLAAYGEVGTHDAHVGTVYNFGIALSATGSQSVRVISARARHLSPGLTQTAARLGYYCDGQSHYIIAGVGADLMRSDAPYNITGLSDRRVVQSARDPCWYLLLRFIPTQLGKLEASDGEVTYKIGFRTYHKRFAFHTDIDTTATGADPREIVVR